MAGCGDVLTLVDLQTAKKHQIFEAEVITGKQGGLAGGADIDYATNQVTGQVQKTLPAILRDAGFQPAAFDFTTGGTLGVNDRNKVVYDPVSMTWYSWSGALPHVIAAGTNPVGDANWIAQTDPNLRSELASLSGASMIGATNSVTVQDAVDAINPVKALDKLLSRLIDTQKVNLIESVNTVQPIIVPSLRTIEGNGFASGVIGSFIGLNKTISKTGNATATFTGASLTSTVDTVLALTDQFTPIDSSQSFYPQELHLKDLTIKGDATTPNEVGVFVHQGGRLSCEDVKIINCISGIWGRKLWQSTFIRTTIQGGCFRFGAGGTATSLSLINCGASGHVSMLGAYNIQNTQYSTLQNCTSDNAPNTAFLFVNAKVSLDGCGAELATSLQPTTTGSALAIATGCDITVNNFNCSPRTNQTDPLISLGSNSTVYINGWNSDFGIPYETDVIVNANNATMIFENSRFLAGSKLPVVKFAPGTLSGQVIVRDGVNEWVYSSPGPAGGVRTNPEIRYVNGTAFTPVLNANNAVTDASVISATGSYFKTGNTVHVVGSVTLSGKGTIGNAAIISIAGLPYAAAADFSANVIGYSGVSSVAGMWGVVNTGAKSLYLLIPAGSTGSTNLTGLNLTATTSIKFSATYVLNNSLFK